MEIETLLVKLAEILEGVVDQLTTVSINQDKTGTILDHLLTRIETLEKPKLKIKP